MRRTTALVAAMAMALSPTAAFAQAPGNGQTNGAGWVHTNGPSSTGQPGLECPEEAGDPGTRPGHAQSAPGSAFNPDGNAGTHYAGEQPQNSRNTASVSQYDTACFGSDRPGG
ncbi:MAG TPA: hypothetical protein VF079_11805 [Sphingomicrobium sp.]